MAQYDITRACEHRETIQIYGTDRWNRREWIAGKEAQKLCQDCARDAREAAGHAAAEQAQQDGLPALTGNPKQVTWAETIRAQTVVRLDKLRLEIGRRLAQRPDMVALADLQAQAITTALHSHTDARWWIDQRDPGAYVVIRTEASQILKSLETGQ